MAKKSAQTTTILNTLAKAALPLNEAEWGSERQLAAENAFFSYVELYLKNAGTAKRNAAARAEWERFFQWCLRATTEEMVNEAMHLLGLHRRAGEADWR